MMGSWFFNKVNTNRVLLPLKKESKRLLFPTYVAATEIDTNAKDFILDHLLWLTHFKLICCPKWLRNSYRIFKRGRRKADISQLLSWHLTLKSFCKQMVQHIIYKEAVCNRVLKMFKYPLEKWWKAFPGNSSKSCWKTKAIDFYHEWIMITELSVEMRSAFWRTVTFSSVPLVRLHLTCSHPVEIAL